MGVMAALCRSLDEKIMSRQFKVSMAILAVAAVAIGTMLSLWRHALRPATGQILGLRQFDVPTETTTNVWDLNGDGVADKRMISGPDQGELAIWLDGKWVPVRYLKGNRHDQDGNDILLSLTAESSPTNYVWRGGKWIVTDPESVSRFVRDLADLQSLASKTGVPIVAIMTVMEQFFDTHTNVPMNVDTNTLDNVREVAYAYSGLLVERGDRGKAVGMLEYILRTHPCWDVSMKVQVDAIELYVFLAEKASGTERTRYLKRAEELAQWTLWH